ncbi:hypothetical protein [Fodinicola acaciae]|uniref:hypothetical protein n=1 Tax=Fodinicola acaciae TaxID=2681555 RepID=UPI0013D1F58F|nr:hypothetical protein [Fodinicola acaciae]
MTGNWSEVVSRHWLREATVVPAAAPIGLSAAFGLTVEACAPFRAGTRFGALPDVRFRAADGVIRAPGELLPDAADQSFDGYLDRVRGCQLTVEQPLLLDFAHWSAVRDELRALWRRVGWPSLSVVPELVAGDGESTVTAGETHAELAWILTGSLRTADGAAVSAGELLFRPAGRRAADTVDRCVMLRLRVPTDGRLAFVAVKDALAEALDARRDGDAVPYVPVGETVRPVARVAEEFREAVNSVVVERTLRVQAAKRWSAGGLEPVAPRPPASLTTGTRIRRTAEIARVPAGSDRWIWTVNGHGLPLSGRAGDRLLAELPLGREVGVGQLCDAMNAADRVDAVVRLLSALYRLYAFELVGEGA